MILRIHKTIYNHYMDLYEKFGDNSSSLGWPKGRQNLRFKIMSDIEEIKNSKVLDVGCGFGDFLSYLNAKKKCELYWGRY